MENKNGKGIRIIKNYELIILLFKEILPSYNHLSVSNLNSNDLPSYSSLFQNNKTITTLPTAESRINIIIRNENYGLESIETRGGMKR